LHVILSVVLKTVQLTKIVTKLILKCPHRTGLVIGWKVFTVTNDLAYFLLLVKDEGKKKFYDMDTLTAYMMMRMRRRTVRTQPTMTAINDSWETCSGRKKRKFSNF
jgi:hypothetical protein